MSDLELRFGDLHVDNTVVTADQAVTVAASGPPDVGLDAPTTEEIVTDEGLSSDLSQVDTPIHNIPAEILAKILTPIVLADITGLDDKYVIDLPFKGWRRSPWKLGHVCSRWRETLWNASEVWRFIRVTEPTSAAKDERCLAIFNHILAHTNGLMSLTISWSSKNDVLPKMIEASSHRLNALVVEDWTEFAIQILKFPFPHLENLEMKTNAGSLASLAPHPKISAAGAIHPIFPKLRHLSLETQWDGAAWILYFPISQLQTISFSEALASPSVLYLCLKQGSALTSVKLSHADSDTSKSDEDIQVILPITSNLESLELGHDWDVSLEHLILPRLKRLAIGTNSSPGIDPILAQALTALRARSQFVLESLSILDPDKDSDPNFRHPVYRIVPQPLEDDAMKLHRRFCRPWANLVSNLLHILRSFVQSSAPGEGCSDNSKRFSSQSSPRSWTSYSSFWTNMSSGAPVNSSPAFTFSA